MHPSTTSSFRCKPPKKTGSLRVYFAQLKDFFKSQEVTSEEEKIAIFKLGLAGHDYERFVLHTELPHTFALIEQHLLHIYEPSTCESEKSRLFDAQQVSGETCAEFAERIKLHVRESYPMMGSGDREQLAIDLLKRGLKPRYAEHLHLTEAIDLPGLLRFLRRLENAPTKVHAVREEDRGPDKMDLLLERMDQLCATLRSQAQDTRPARECWNCGATGHLSFRCRAPDSCCDRCGGRHLERYCRVQRGARVSAGQGRHGIEESQVCTVADFTSVFGELGGIPRIIMVDSGASPCLISEE